MATVQKRGNSYRITVSCGYDINGRQIRKTTTWTPEPGMTPKQEEKELERQKVLFEERCRSGQVLDGSIKFADFADKWFTDYAEKQLRVKTLNRYKDLMKRINPAIGHIRLDKLRPDHLLAFYDNLAEEGVKVDTKYSSIVDMKAVVKQQGLTKTALSEKAGVSLTVLTCTFQGKNICFQSAESICRALGKPFNELFHPSSESTSLSSKTILHHHRLISSILSTAVQWQVVFSNPCDRIKPPKVEKKDPRYLDEKQAALLLELLEQEGIQYRTMIKLLLYTGLRRGELCGLEWKDIDWKNNLLRVCRSSLYSPEKGIFVDETKNNTSNRTIKMPGAAGSMLWDYKRWQAEQRLQLGDQWQDNDRLFTAWNGTPIHPDLITNWFHDFIKKHGLPDISIHSLRHTNATLQIAGGVPLSAVAERLGHANTATTSTIYVHAIKSANEAAAEVLENILEPTSKQDKMG